MKLSNYESSETAKTELCRNGFFLAFTPPGTPSRWVRTVGERGYAVAERAGVWLIVNYPED